MTVFFSCFNFKTSGMKKSQDCHYLLLGLRFPGGCFSLLLRNLVYILSHRDLPLFGSHAPASAFWNPPLNAERRRYMMQQYPNQDSKRKAMLSCCGSRKLSAQLKIFTTILKNVFLALHQIAMLRIAHSYTNLSNLVLKQVFLCFFF